MYSKVIMVGNLTRDIELRYLQSGSAVAKSAIAYTDGFGDNKKSHFIDFVAFGKTAEALNNFCKKGSKIMIEGIIQFEQWTAQDGSARSRHSLRVETMKMLDTKSSDTSSSQHQENDNREPEIEYQHNGQTTTAPSFEQRVPEIDIDDDEIPF